MDKIVTVESCRAYLELKGREPLTEKEYRRLLQLVATCRLQGEPFDEVSWVYPLRIPTAPHVTVLSEEPRVVAVGVQHNKNKFVGVIGDAKLEMLYNNNLGEFIYAVGEIVSKKKGDKEYWNLRPRGWLVVRIKPESVLKRKKSKK